MKIEMQNIANFLRETWLDCVKPKFHFHSLSGIGDDRQIPELATLVILENPNKIGTPRIIPQRMVN